MAARDESPHPSRRNQVPRKVTNAARLHPTRRVSRLAVADDGRPGVSRLRPATLERFPPPPLEQSFAAQVWRDIAAYTKEAIRAEGCAIREGQRGGEAPHGAAAPDASTVDGAERVWAGIG